MRASYQLYSAHKNKKYMDLLTSYLQWVILKVVNKVEKINKIFISQ